MSNFAAKNGNGKKKCFYCGSISIIKYDCKGQKQRYLCKKCGKQFVFRQIIDNQSLWRDYIFGKQTLQQLSERYNISTKSVSRSLSKIRTTRVISSDKEVVVLMDTTYWGRDFGVAVMKDARRKKILWRKFVRHETLADYKEGVDWLEKNGFKIAGIVCDGLRGMFAQFSGYKVQMCQFHQVKIVQRYLTKRPDLQASKELHEMVKLLAPTDKDTFMDTFEQWENRWSAFLKERGTDKPTGKTYYVHKRLRSAHLSIKHNMPYLWTFYDNMEIGIPNTNNGLEGQFTDLKTKLRNHNGLSKTNRMKFIDMYFKASFPS